MNTIPPVIRDQRVVDAEQLRLLAVFHFAIAGLAVLGICFLLMHFTFMRAFMNSAAVKDSKGGPPPAEFFAIFKWFYLIGGVALLLAGLLNLLSGIFLRQQKHRTFSIVVGALNCIQFPIGTALGVFTFIVLFRYSVRELYETRQPI